MGRYISKKQNILEANQALEKRLITENIWANIPTLTPMDEQNYATGTEPDRKMVVKKDSGNLKIIKLRDVFKFLRTGTLTKYDTFKVKGTGAFNLVDNTGKVTTDGFNTIKNLLNDIKRPLKQGEEISILSTKDVGSVDPEGEATNKKDKIFFQIRPAGTAPTQGQTKVVAKNQNQTMQGDADTNV